MSRRRFALVAVLLSTALGAAVAYVRRDDRGDDASARGAVSGSTSADGAHADASGLASLRRADAVGGVGDETGDGEDLPSASIRSLTLRREGDPDRSLVLRVVDYDGHTRVVGADVVVEAEGAPATSGVTDARGELRLAAVPPARTTLRVNAKDRFPVVLLDVKPGMIEVTARAMGELKGTVVEAGDRAPLASARVRAVPAWARSDGPGAYFDVTTDAGGRFSGRLPANEFTRLVVDVPDGRRYETFADSRARPGDLTVRVPAGGRIVGRVVGRPEGGMSWSGATVVARAIDDPIGERAVGTVGGGEFLFAGIDPARAYTLYATTEEGFASERIEGVRLGPNGVADVVLRLIPPGRVFVALSDETGAPVPGAHVSIDGTHHGVDQGGAESVQRLDAIPVGRHTLRIESALGPAREQVVEVVSGPNRIAVRLDAGIRIDGDVVDGKGLFAPGTRVTLERDPAEGQPADVRTVTTDVRGRFAFGGLAVGTWRLTASAQGASTPQPIPVVAPRRGVQVPLVRFGRVRGRLVRAGGGVLTGDVEIRRTRADEVVSHTDTLVDGAFEVTGFDAESETIELLAEGFAPVKREVRVPIEGELDLGVITVTAGCRVAGVVVDGRGLPVEGAILLVSHHGRTITDPNGRFAFDGVPPGPLPILVVAERFLRRSLEVAAESSAALRIELSSGAHLEGTVVGADGQGVGGLPVAIVPVEGTTAGEPEASLRTDEDGTFDVRVPPGRYRIEAKEDGAATPTLLADVTLADGEERKPTLVFRPR